MDRDLIVGLVEIVDDLAKAVSDLSFSGNKIYDKVEFFHFVAPFIGVEKFVKVITILYNEQRSFTRVLWHN